MNNLVSVILCGGEGKRLSPLSNNDFPKQFLKVGKERRSLFQQTLMRAKSMSDNVIIVSGERFKNKIKKQCEEINFSTPHIILEPSPKNTGPSVALAAMYAKNHFPESIMAVMPSDHIIRQPDVLKNAVKHVAEHAKDNIITFGAVPSSPSSDYGYILTGNKVDNFIFKADRFIEKPPTETAAVLIASSRCYWNSGIFVSSPSCFLSAIKEQPALMESVSKSFRKAKEEDGFTYPCRENFENLLPMQFDKTVVQKAKNLCVIPIEMGWSDVGSIESLWNAAEKDNDGWGIIIQDNKVISFNISGIIKKSG